MEDRFRPRAAVETGESSSRCNRDFFLVTLHLSVINTSTHPLSAFQREIGGLMPFDV